MKTVTKMSAVFGAIAMLSGCASNYDVAGVSAMSDKGDAFASALHKRYIERAEFEVGEGDWASVGFFNSRAEMAANGEAPAAQMPSDRNLKVDANDIAQSYETLSAALKTNAPQVTPDACALSQTWFEHWMEQSAEGHQPTHVTAARSEFEKAMPNCKGEVAAMPAPAPMPSAMSASFLIYFDHNSSDLTKNGKLITAIASRVGMNAYASRAVLVGHTDSSGASAYNVALSQKRAQTVADAMLANGFPAAEVRSAHAGEKDLMVKTGDGVREGKNRRVEIRFEK